MKKIIQKITLKELSSKFTYLSDFFDRLNEIEVLEKFEIKGKNDNLEVSLFFDNDVEVKEIDFLNLDNKVDMFNRIADICRP